MWSSRRWLPLLLATVPATCGCSLFQATGEKVDRRADEQLRMMSQVLANAKSLSFCLRIASEDLFLDGRWVQCVTDRQVYLRRPDKLFVSLQAEGEGRRFWFDGKRVTLLDVDRRGFGSFESPGDVDQMLNNIKRDYGYRPPTSDLLRSDPYHVFHSDAHTIRYLGRSEVGDIVCHLVAVERDSADWQLWIEASATPLPRKLVVRRKDTPMPQELTATLDAWQLSPHLADEQFSFRLPEDAYQVEVLDVVGLP